MSPIALWGSPSSGRAHSPTTFSEVAYANNGAAPSAPCAPAGVNTCDTTDRKKQRRRKKATSAEITKNPTHVRHDENTLKIR
eukprot:3240837-Pyramimonas_sp.AAC.2